MSTKLDDRYAIQGGILYLRTIDGRKIRMVYPIWNSIYPTSFRTICSEYMNGANNSGRNCYTQVRSILDSIFGNTPDMYTAPYMKQYKILIDGLLPISPYKESKYPRELYAYGIYAALSCGMQMDFSQIVEKCNFIKENIYDKDKAQIVKNTINRLALEVRQMNYIGSMLTAPANTSATCTNVIRALTMSEKQIAELPEHVRTFIKTFNNEMHSRVNNPNLYKVLQNLTPTQFKELLIHVDKLTVRSVNKISGHVSTATGMIEGGDLYKPLDESSIKKASIENVINNIIESLGKLPTGRLDARIVMDTIKGSTLESFNELESTIENDVIHSQQAAQYTEDYINTGRLPERIDSTKIDEISDEYIAINPNANSEFIPE